MDSCDDIYFSCISQSVLVFSSHTMFAHQLSVTDQFLTLLISVMSWSRQFFLFFLFFYLWRQLGAQFLILFLHFKRFNFKGKGFFCKISIFPCCFGVFLFAWLKKLLSQALCSNSHFWFGKNNMLHDREKINKTNGQKFPGIHSFFIFFLSAT